MKSHTKGEPCNTTKQLFLSKKKQITKFQKYINAKFIQISYSSEKMSDFLIMICCLQITDFPALETVVWCVVVKPSQPHGYWPLLISAHHPLS